MCSQVTGPTRAGGAVAALWIAALASMLGMSAHAATINVSTTADAYAADGLCSLREAITSANNDASPFVLAGECGSGSGVDLILVPSGLYLLSRTGAQEESNLTGDLDIRSSLNIRGAGIRATQITSNATDRIFDVNVQGVTVSIEDLQLFLGVAPAADTFGGGGIRSFARQIALRRVSLVRNGLAVSDVSKCGGGLLTFNFFGSALIEDSEFDGNLSAVGAPGGNPRAGDGAAICTSGTVLTVRRTRFTGNNAAGQSIAQGGALALEDSSALIEDSVFVSNAAGSSGDGGAIWHSVGSLTVRRSSFTGHSANRGAVVFLSGAEVNIESSSFAQNRANQGGVFMLASTVDTALSVKSSTFVGNSSAGGAVVDASECTISGRCSVSLWSNLMARGAPEDGTACVLAAAVGLASRGGNALLQGDSCSLAHPNDLQLASSGIAPAQTDARGRRFYLPLEDGPLIDSGDCAGLNFDQAGASRPVQQPQPDRVDGCDIGAIELPALILFGNGFEAPASSPVHR